MDDQPDRIATSTDTTPEPTDYEDYPLEEWDFADLFVGELMDTMVRAEIEFIDRECTFRNTKALMTELGSNIYGTIFINFAINRAGDVTYAEIDQRTTMRSRDTLKTVLKIFMEYKFEADENAPVQQCGRYKFKLDIGKFN